ncbi:hypothetical protein KY289_004929 [Solanum tuberosum]|nr:hypothetical protein KY289_004929 [Solanum tuberosum]
MCDIKKESLLNKNKGIERTVSNAYDELRSFRTWLKWMCVDQSNAFSTCLSWFVFILLAVIVPCLSHFLLARDDSDAAHSRPYDNVVQLSLSSVAALSFVCLSQFVKKYGLRRFLFLDKLCDESETVRRGYTEQLNSSLKILFIFVLPCFAVECAYKIWWYSSGGTRIPFVGNVIVSDTVACILELSSWLYRTVVFFLVCILFRLICYLQILRLQDFAQVFHVDSDVESVLREHLRIRRHLRIISHRYRSFILWALMFVTASQFASLLMTTRSTADLHIYKSGEGDYKVVNRTITNKVKVQVAKFVVKVALLCQPSRRADDTVVKCNQNYTQGSIRYVPCSQVARSSDADDVGDEEDELDNTKFVHAYAYSTISFQKRQALGGHGFEM